MTALKKYEKLESTGLWRDAPDAQRREVVVNFGDASLVLSDPKTGTALTHWSLPALVRLNSTAMPALYAADSEAAETLEIDDALMVGAIETVRGAIEKARARPGRLRATLLGGGIAIALLLAVFWLPSALISQTAAMVPAATRAEIGRMALADLTRLTGVPCANPAGLAAAMTLSERVLGQGGGQILILRDGLNPAAHLPGGLVLLSSKLVEPLDGPEVAAGYALAEKTRAELSDPLIPVLQQAGLLATLRLLTSGRLPPGALSGYAETLLVRPPLPVGDEALLVAFRDASVPSTPYAYAVDPTGETTLPLIEADPLRGASAVPILPDTDWVQLQSICQDQKG